MRSTRWTRRQVVAAGALGTAGIGHAAGENVCSRIGASPFINLTAPCAITGGDPEKMTQPPGLDGLRDRVVIPKQSRNVYDHAIRVAGGTMAEMETREEWERAIGPRTAMIAVLGAGEPKGKVRLEEIAAIARRTRVPVLVDAADEMPVTPNPYLTRGAGLVAYSGGKFPRGPQCAGVLQGRGDLVRAAWLNRFSHRASGRAMRVGRKRS